MLLHPTARIVVSLAAVAAAIAPFAFAQGPATTAPASRPAGLSVSLIANKDTYTLNPAQSGKEFRNQMAALRGRAPTPPAIDVTLRFTNNTAAPVTLPFGGDDSTLLLKLGGENAVNVQNMVPMTMEFRTGRPVTIRPGETYDHKITSLSSGARGIGQCAYFTEPGNYTLTAEFVFHEGERRVSLISPPLPLKVTKE